MPPPALADVFALPSQCAVCRSWSRARLCGACVQRFAAPTPRCRRCAIGVPAGIDFCGACLLDPPPFDSALAAVDYAYPWDSLAQRLKFHAALDLAGALAALLCDAVRRRGDAPLPDRVLPVPLKIKLTRGASRTLRGILIRDTNQSVALSVVNNAAMTDDEIAQVAGSRSVIDEVLTVISRRREWLAKYKICLALARNPRIPVGVAVKLLPKLSVRDLRTMSKDRNVSDAVRSSAGRLYRIKTK